MGIFKKVKYEYRFCVLTLEKGKCNVKRSKKFKTFPEAFDRFRKYMNFQLYALYQIRYDKKTGIATVDIIKYSDALRALYMTHGAYFDTEKRVIRLTDKFRKFASSVNIGNGESFLTNLTNMPPINKEDMEKKELLVIAESDLENIIENLEHRYRSSVISKKWKIDSLELVFENGTRGSIMSSVSENPNFKGYEFIPDALAETEIENYMTN